jgi:type IV pilus assembly protein PilY1
MVVLSSFQSVWAAPSQLPLLEGPSVAGVAVAGRVLGVEARKYTPSYRSEDWSGDLQAHAVDAEGAEGALLWRASAQLPAPALRNIWTGSINADGRGAVRFDWTSLSAAGMSGLLGSAASQRLLDYLRGDRAGEGDTYRVRGGTLGDIVNSQPVVVRDRADFQYGFLPAGTPGRDSYRSFLRDKAARAGVLFFGANDGMLHAVRESDGIEVFAFIPSAVLPRMVALASPDYIHRFYVDGPLAEGDAWWDARWHNVLVGTTGAGPAAVYAIDVTDPTALRGTSVLWEFNAQRDAELGSVLSAPETGVMRDGQWVAVFGNGYGGAAGRARLYIVNLQTGALVRSLDAHGGPGNGLGGVRVVRDGSNRIVGAYAGDLAGNLWRFDLSSADPAQWRVGFAGLPLFTARDAAGKPQAITAAPEYLAHPQGGLLVLSGTGRLFEDQDLGDIQVQALYGLWDRAAADADSATAPRIAPGAALARHAFGQVDAPRAGSSSAAKFDTVVAQPVDWAIHSGWHLPLPARFRDIYGAALQRGFVRFKVVAPALLDARARVVSPAVAMDLQLNPLTGAMSSQPLFDTNGDGVVNLLDRVVAGVRMGAEGRGEVALDAKGRGKIQDSAGKPVTIDYGRPRITRAWRQIVNFPQ